METGSPSITKILTMVLFALSVIGLTLFLWLSFGGTIPLTPRGYEFRVSFTNASQLADQADVRIAGVSVGKVVGKTLDPIHNRTMVTIQMNNKFAPIHRDAQAILRTKTIAGEIYVQLTPGTAAQPHARPTAACSPRGQVANAVQLDQIFNALDPTTRAAFRQWQQQLAIAVQGNDQNLNSVLGNLPTFAADASDLLKVLDIQHTAVVNLVRNGGTVFGALGQSQTALRDLITSGEQTFRTTAANNTAISATFHVFPTFLDETKATMARLQSFAQDTDPLVKELEPVATNLKPTLTDVRELAPVAALVLRQPRAADHGLQDRPARHPRRAQRRHAAAGLARPVPGAAQPGAQLAVAAPAAHRRLHLQRRRRPGRQDDELRRRRHRPLPAPVPAHRRRDAVLRCQPRRGQPRQHLPAAAVAGRRASDFSAGGKHTGSFALPSWDCNNTGAPGDGSQPTSSGVPSITQTATPACWVAPPLGSLMGQSGKFPHITPAHYSNK